MRLAYCRRTSRVGVALKTGYLLRSKSRDAPNAGGLFADMGCRWETYIRGLSQRESSRRGDENIQKYVRKWQLDKKEGIAGGVVCSLALHQRVKVVGDSDASIFHAVRASCLSSSMEGCGGPIDGWYLDEGLLCQTT